MVVTGSPHATEAGRRMLEAGGNAADAAVAAAFALAVAEPTQSGLGGRTQVLLRRADGSVHALDGITEFPSGYDPATAPRGEHGHAAVGIPGTVAALTRLLEDHGTLPLATVVEPARRWAAEGLVPEPAEARRLAGLVEELGPASPVSRAFGGPGGEPREPDALLVQPELAAVLETIAAEGAEGFYRGPVADRMARDMEAHGGFVTGEDLAGYRARDALPARGSFRGHTVHGSYLPASGATVIEILQILDRLELPSDEARWSAVVAEALLAGFEDREIGEGRSPAAAVAWLTSDSLADRRAAVIAGRLGVPLRPVTGAAGPGGGVEGALEEGPFPRRSALPPPSRAVALHGEEPAFTTHVSVADGDGNAVALTQSLGPTGGARVVTPGLGFLYASTMGGYLAGGGPGYRPWSSQAPLLVLRGGEPWLVLGGAGARRILSALVATVTRMVDRGLSLEEALAAPRIHPSGGRIHVEEGWPEAEALAELGYTVEPRERSWFARLMVVERTEGGGFLGAGDPRWSGSAAAGPDPRR
jgi:gamma-glutamyltranspeptidase/glutathione hydrolase